MKLLLPGSLTWTLDAPMAVEVVEYDPRQPIPKAHHDAEAVVLYGNSAKALTEQAQALQKVRWVQTLQAGANAMLSAGFRADAICTVGRHLHSTTVAEHTLAMLLALTRRIHRLRDAQNAAIWTNNTGVGTLAGSQVLVLGFGSIAQEIARLLRQFGAHVTAAATHARRQDDVEVVAMGTVPQLLPTCDIVVMVLPATPATGHAVDARMLSLLPPHALLVNVGRGSTLDESALIAALQAGKLAGAALDVFEQEPLPATSPLWSMPEVLVSPHVAGGIPHGYQALVHENLTRLLAGQPLLHVAERARGY
jgi:phosphoglycerate dehydrogenase-like enzyme